MTRFFSKPFLLLMVPIVFGLGLVVLVMVAGTDSALAKGAEAAPDFAPAARPVAQVYTETETGAVCINDYQPDSVCTANDVRIVGIEASNVISPCSGEGSTAIASFIFDIRAQAQGSSPDRYDIGIFIDLDGVPATGNKMQGGAQLSGVVGQSNPDGVVRNRGCFHTYLAPPLTSTPAYSITPNDRSLGVGEVVNITDGVTDLYDGPWVDNPSEGDMCGDIDSGTQLFKTIQTIAIVCSDSDGDSRVDMSVCTSWDNQTGSVCSTVSDTWPNTKSKCSCGYVNFPFDPTGITLGEISASETNRWLLPIVGVLLVLAVTTIVVLRKQTTAEEIV